MTAAITAGLALVTALLAVLVAGLLRSHAEIIRALHDAGVSLDPAGTNPSDPIGLLSRRDARAERGASAAVDIHGESVLGGNVHVAIAGTRHRSLLAFLSSTCMTCRGFWETFADPTTPLPGRARLIVVVRDVEAESPSALERLVAPHVITVHSSQAWEDYAVPGAPYFVLVDGSEGRIVGEGTATTWDHVRNLLEQALGDVMHPNQAEREAHVDAELRAAGIDPGDPSLYPGGAR